MRYINYLEEITPYLEQFRGYRVDGNKLISCSPLRDDKTPSFVIFLDKGNWKDSGSGRAGYFAELLAFLSNQSIDEVYEYLNGEDIVYSTENLELKINLELKNEIKENQKKTRPAALNPSDLIESDYLLKRGISEEVQKIFGIKYMKNTLIIPWRDKKGEVIRYQFRSTTSKKFWYSGVGEDIKSNLFGLSLVIKKGIKKVYITESAIDSLYLWSLGIPAIATSTASISKNQVNLILNSEISEIVIAADNDLAGGKFKDQLKEVFKNKKKLYEFEFPPNCKDINDITREKVLALKEQPVIELNITLQL